MTPKPAYTLIHRAESRDSLERDRVWESVWWWYKGLAQFRLKWESAHLSPEHQKTAFPLLDKQARGDLDLATFDKEDMVIVGTRDECLQECLKYDEIGVDQLLCYLDFGYLPNEAVLKSIELLGKHVIPALAKRGANRATAALTERIGAAERRLSAIDAAG